MRRKIDKTGRDSNLLIFSFIIRSSVVSTKCYIDQLSFRSNVVSIKCRFDQVISDQLSFDQFSGHVILLPVNYLCDLQWVTIVVFLLLELLAGKIMAQNRYTSNDILGMLSDEESQMEVANEEENGFYESGTETSDDENLDISDYLFDMMTTMIQIMIALASDDGLILTLTFKYFQFTAKNVGPTFNATAQTELEYF